MNNKKGFELSVNMIVVIVLGLVMLGSGIAIFNQGFGKAVALREEMSQQQQLQLNRLLDDGSLIVIPFSVKEADRGDFADFDLAIANEFNKELSFYVLITYAGADVAADAGDLSALTQCPRQVSGGDSLSYCGNLWPLYNKMPDVPNSYTPSAFLLQNNERAFIPIRVQVPKKVGPAGLPKGQYVFNVDVCYADLTEGQTCQFNGQGLVSGNRLGSRQKIYVNV